MFRYRLYNTFHYELTGGQATTADIHDYFPSWFKQQLACNVESSPQLLHLRNLSEGPIKRVNKWHTYFVNGYKFHTDEWTEGKKTINSGVFVKGVTDGGEDDFYGVITHIYELEYNYLDSKNKVVLFYCDWYDPSDRGTKINKKYNTVEIKMDRRYKHYDHFIMAHLVRQVYYVPYPSIQRGKRDWCVAIKSKPIGHIETDELMEDLAYQVDEISQNNDVTEVEQLTSLCDNEVEGQQVDDVDGDDEESKSEDN